MPIWMAMPEARLEVPARLLLSQVTLAGKAG